MLSVLQQQWQLRPLVLQQAHYNSSTVYPC